MTTLPSDRSHRAWIAGARGVLASFVLALAVGCGTGPAPSAPFGCECQLSADCHCAGPAAERCPCCGDACGCEGVENTRACSCAGTCRPEVASPPADH